MGIRSLLSSSVMVGAKKIMKGKRRNQQQKHHCQHMTFPSAAAAVPKGHIAVYLLGDDQRKEETPMKRFVLPISYVNHPMFGELLDMAEAEFGFHHSMGALTLPCDEDSFLHLISSPAF
ncbi:unnamed protein product [Linum tenue]|uniref:Uncharacterized protein n=1 Tax=Linum tenue TaxID=586396 RepID=A0AAV0GX54_9ROSI|nr:unnamed protein product [Linum tenue]